VNLIGCMYVCRCVHGSQDRTDRQTRQRAFLCCMCLVHSSLGRYTDADTRAHTHTRLATHVNGRGHASPSVVTASPSVVRSVVKSAVKPGKMDVFRQIEATILNASITSQQNDGSRQSDESWRQDGRAGNLSGVAERLYVHAESSHVRAQPVEFQDVAGIWSSATLPHSRRQADGREGRRQVGRHRAVALAGTLAGAGMQQNEADVSLCTYTRSGWRLR
jgi:hypothetical protein